MRALAISCAVLLCLGPACAQTPNGAAPDEQLWRQIEHLSTPTPIVEPYDARFAMERDRLERLISRLASYRRQFPGGARSDDAVVLELAAHLHLATLTNSGTRFAEHCRALSARPMSDALRRRVTRYQDLADRLAGGPEFLEELRRSAAADDADAAAAPVPRPAAAPSGSTSIDAAHPATAQEVDAQASGAPDTARNAAALRRAAAIGTPLAFEADSDLTTSLRAAGLCERPILIVVWASWDERSVEAAALAQQARAACPTLGTLGLCIDLDPARMREAIDAYALDGVQLRAEQGWASPLLTTWNLRRLPALLLIDSGGVLRAIEEDGDVFEVVRRLDNL